MNLKNMKAKLVDVFAERRLSGNGLTIFWDYSSLTEKEMLALTREMRQFESVFVQGEPGGRSFEARIFTMEEELEFAGHPLIGVAAHLHEEYGTQETHEWTIRLAAREVALTSRIAGDYYSASMEQGPPEYISVLKKSDNAEIITALNLNTDDIADIPFAVISTGLPYLIVPVTRGIEKARIITRRFEALLHRYGARFVYVLDMNTFEGRTWDNEGKVEDIATGSAAGPAASFLFKAGRVRANETFYISQGRMVDRPGKIKVFIRAEGDVVDTISVSGTVRKVASIVFV